MFKRTVSLCMVGVGLIFVVLGIINFLQKEDFNQSQPIEVRATYQQYSLDSKDLTFGYNNYEISSVTFGADFYTYIYKGVVKAVSALDWISTQLSASSVANQAIYDGLGMTLQSQNETNALLQDNLKAINQLTQVSYEAGMKQIEQSKNLNSIAMLGIGFAFLFYGLIRFSETLSAAETRIQLFAKNKNEVSSNDMEMNPDTISDKISNE